MAEAAERMSRVDTAWLRMDNDVNLMMIIGVWLLTPAVGLQALRERIADKLLQYGRFRQKAVADPMGAMWVTDEDFDIARHVVGTRLRTATPNTRPTANPGPDQSVAIFANVQLDGGASSDLEGDPLTFVWTVLSRPAGSTAALSDPTGVRPSFVADREGTFVIQLTVSDSRGASSSASVTVTVGPNRAPIITSSALATGEVGQVYVYDVAASDPDAGDTLTFLLPVAPDGMTIDAATGRIVWTPQGSHIRVTSSPSRDWLASKVIGRLCRCKRS